MQIEPYRSDHASAIAALCHAEGWDSWEDVASVDRALSAPGVRTLVALDEDEGPRFYRSLVGREMTGFRLYSR